MQKICTYADCPSGGQLVAFEEKQYNHYGCDVCSKYWDDFAAEDSKCHVPDHVIKEDHIKRWVCTACGNAE
jgi:hypothetical protein